MPFAPDSDFVDRPEIIAWVRDKCAGAGARAALVGLGGVGYVDIEDCRFARDTVLTDHSKSQLALQFAHSIRDANPQTFVFWVHAGTRARFEEAYRDIADRLQLPGRNDPTTDVLQSVSDWLRDETNGQWVMVIDNADDVDTVSQQDKANVSQEKPLATFLPQSLNGAILVTSRSRDAAIKLVGGDKNTKEVLTMNEREGLQLLHNKLRDLPAEENASELLQELNYIPLAITQAAAYINRGARMTVARYMEQFRKSSKKQESLLRWDASELRRDPSACNSVVTTWQISFEQLQRERRSAAALLSLMSFFNPQGIPVSMLRKCRKPPAAASGERKEEEEEEMEETSSAFDEDLDALLAYSLVSVMADADICEMHALVQFCTRVWLASSGDAERWEHTFLMLMAKELPSGEYENWAKCQQLLPHVETLFDRKPRETGALKAWTQLLTNAAWYLSKQGNYRVAEEVVEKAIAVGDETQDREDQSTLLSLGVLALVLRAQGKYEKSEALNRRTLRGLQYHFGEQHPSALASASNLAAVLRAQGRYGEAETLIRQTLAGRKKKLGEQHFDTLTSVASLAMVLYYKGEYSEAEALNRQALEGYEKELGQQHPDTLMVVSNHALVLRAQGRYKEAEILHRQALAGRTKELGEQHSDTLTSVSNLALALQYQGKYEEAEILNRRALESRRKELGEKHPDTRMSLNNLAGTLHCQGKHEKAEILHRQALEGWMELGEKYPETLACMNNLALALLYQAKYDDAEKLNRQALEGRLSVLGDQHPDTLASMRNLAGVLQHQAKYDDAAAESKFVEAERLNRRSLEGRVKVLGEHHPDTLGTAYCLAYLLHIRRRYTEATVLYQQACNGRAKQLGPEHPDTIVCRNHFEAMQQEMQRNETEQRACNSSTQESGSSRFWGGRLTRWMSLPKKQALANHED